MNHENHPKSEAQRFPTYPRWVVGAIAIVGLVVLMIFIIFIGIFLVPFLFFRHSSRPVGGNSPESSFGAANDLGPDASK
jgi:hypothetical protein